MAFCLHRHGFVSTDICFREATVLFSASHQQPSRRLDGYLHRKSSHIPDSVRLAAGMLPSSSKKIHRFLTYRDWTQQDSSRTRLVPLLGTCTRLLPLGHVLLAYNSAYDSRDVARERMQGSNLENLYTLFSDHLELRDIWSVETVIRHPTPCCSVSTEGRTFSCQHLYLWGPVHVSSICHVATLLTLTL